MRVGSQCFIRLVLITLEVPLIPTDKVSHWEHPKDGLNLGGFLMTEKYVFLSAIISFYEIQYLSILPYKILNSNDFIISMGLGWA